MAHYRKIDVRGKTYEFVVGADTFKVKGLGEFKKSEWGDPYHSDDTEHDGPIGYSITPGHVRKAIMAKNVS